MAKHMKNSRESRNNRKNKQKGKAIRERKSERIIENRSNNKNIDNIKNSKTKVDKQYINYKKDIDGIKNNNKENQRNQKNQKKSKKISKILLFFRIISLIVIVICLYEIANWYFENKKNNEMLDDMVSNYIESTKQIIIGEETISVLEINFDDLLEKNSDTVGWLTVKGTRINYPVVHYTDNDYYLTHSFDKSYNSAGWVFANYLNKFDGTDKNITFFGHNRRDGSMFATLKDTIKKEWYTNEENYYITLDTPNGTEIYKVFSNYQIEAESYYITNDFNDQNEYKEFLNKILSRSVYNYGVQIDENDKIITLSTCANDNTYRVVLHAVKIN